MQRSIELLDKVLSEYDEHVEAEGEGGGDSGSGGGSGDRGGGGNGSGVGGVGDCGSSTEPSIGLTPDDESPSLGNVLFSRLSFRPSFYFLAGPTEPTLHGRRSCICRERLTTARFAWKAGPLPYPS